ncbi:MAG: outer membrane lipoprotein carrier protein LolA [Myxococcales bacterium]|nr:outer membrane lipoprotein carrier protein LolA [Myxococcales bacterium]
MMNRRHFLALSAALPAGLWLGAARADVSGVGPLWDATSDALDALAKARKPLKTLVAKFKQTRVIGLLAEPVVSSGQLTLVNPDQLRWELYAPDDITYWVSPSGVAYKSGKAKKATKAPADAFGKALPDLVAFLGGDLAKLKSRYELSATTEKDGSIEVVATVTDAKLKEALKKLRMKTNAEKWGIAKVVIEEPKGDSSSITFEANKRDEKVDPDSMKPPA